MGSNNTTKKRIQPTLPLDCIVEILEYLRNDNKSLFSNLFVNRTWCQLIIPLLWCRPFDIRNTMIIETLILCLSKPEKSALIEKMSGIQNFSNFNMENSPLFDYPLYVRGLDYRKLEILIENWVSCSNNHRNHVVTFLFNLIGNLIFTRSRGLTILTLEHYDYYYYKFRKSNYTSFKDILSFNNIKHSLEHLQSLEIKFFSETYDEKVSSEIISSLFLTLSKYSKNIRHIFIDVSVEETILFSQICDSFANLIESQTNLITLEVNQYLGFSFVNSLHTQSNSLSFLKINYLKNFHSLLPALSACTNLETLEFSEYFKIEEIDDLVNSIDNLSPIHIKNLLAYQIDLEHIEDNFILPMIILIKLSEKTLTSLTLDHVNQEILETISINCPTIKYLSLSIIPEEISFFSSKFLSSLTCLESLIFIEDFNGDLLSRTEENLLDIASNLPSSLKYFGFWFMDCDILHDFLQRINVPIKELDIFKGLNDDEMKDVINYARKNNCLKRFGYRKVFSSDSNISKEYFNEAKSIIPIIDEARYIKHYVIST